MEILFWSGVTNEERYSAMDSIQIVIKKYGDIVDFKMFSDMSLSFKIEVTASKINALYSELNETLSMKAFTLIKLVSDVERTVFLNVSFGKGTGRLTIQVPSVPG
ncbi:MAG: hypothetical protein ACOYN4_09760 [Bacteroidales bacterium]